jgi:hypothetical protein
MCLHALGNDEGDGLLQALCHRYFSLVDQLFVVLCGVAAGGVL